MAVEIRKCLCETQQLGQPLEVQISELSSFQLGLDHLKGLFSNPTGDSLTPPYSHHPYNKANSEIFLAKDMAGTLFTLLGLSSCISSPTFDSAASYKYL